MYKLSCTQCNFVYYGQTERSLKTQIVEHKKAVASFDQKSKVAGHVHLFGYNGNGIAFIKRVFYVDIFKCALQHFVGDFCQTALWRSSQSFLM